MIKKQQPSIVSRLETVMTKSTAKDSQNWKPMVKVVMISFTAPISTSMVTQSSEMTRPPKHSVMTHSMDMQETTTCTAVLEMISSMVEKEMIPSMVNMVRTLSTVVTVMTTSTQALAGTPSLVAKAATTSTHTTEEMSSGEVHALQEAILTRMRATMN